MRDLTFHRYLWLVGSNSYLWAALRSKHLSLSNPKQTAFTGMFRLAGPLEWAKVSAVSIRHTLRQWRIVDYKLAICKRLAVKGDWLSFSKGNWWGEKKGLKCSPSHYISAIVIAESIKETPVDLCYSSQYLTLPSTCQNMSRGFILWGVISGSH